MKNKKYLRDNEHLMREWSYEKNSEFDPNLLTTGSDKKVWWKCHECGHEWEASISNRSMGKGCPICALSKRGKNKIKILVEKNGSLFEKRIDLAREWDYEKNAPLTPKDVTIGSSKKVWWKCNKGHEWEACIKTRSNGIGCPFCSGRQPIIGNNDLATINPALAKEWNYEKNGELEPNMVKPNSDKKVWWKCNKGHEWEAIISSRNRGNGCPICVKELQTSFPEQAIYFYIKKLFPDAINSDHHLNMELDIFIPSKKVAIEYDGVFWHKNSQRDERKNKLCEENKILLFRVKEDFKEKSIENDYLRIIPCTYSDEGIKSAIEHIAKYLGKNIDVNLDRDRILIYTAFINAQKEHSLMIINPTLAKEWNYEKNGELKPDMVKANSRKKVWWKCDKGHEWKAVVYSRTEGVGCPICASQQILKGYNDLATTNSTLVKEWNYEKNGELKPDMVMANTNRKVWWKCNKGHEWEATIPNRSRGKSCPVCQNKQVLKGYNDLATINPVLAEEWNYEKNYPLTPKDITAGSNKKVWWRCNKGHEWEATIYNRTNGNNCSICTNKQVLKGYNDLATINPILAKEWNDGKNGELKPNMVTANSNKKVWWKCNKGHEWEAIISNRNSGRGCPICASKQVLKGYNDLTTVNPTLAKEWNYEKNGELKPDMVTANTNRKVWWKCNKGHEWEATIYNRNREGGCPTCKKQNQY